MLKNTRPPINVLIPHLSPSHTHDSNKDTETYSADRNFIEARQKKRVSCCMMYRQTLYAHSFRHTHTDAHTHRRKPRWAALQAKGPEREDEQIVCWM